MLALLNHIDWGFFFCFFFCFYFFFLGRGWRWWETRALKSRSVKLHRGPLSPAFPLHEALLEMTYTKDGNEIIIYSKRLGLSTRFTPGECFWGTR